MRTNEMVYGLIGTTRGMHLEGATEGQFLCGTKVPKLHYAMRHTAVFVGTGANLDYWSNCLTEGAKCEDCWRVAHMLIGEDENK